MQKEVNFSEFIQGGIFEFIDCLKKHGTKQVIFIDFFWEKFSIRTIFWECYCHKTSRTKC